MFWRPYWRSNPFNHFSHAAFLPIDRHTDTKFKVFLHEYLTPMIRDMQKYTFLVLKKEVKSKLYLKKRYTEIKLKVTFNEFLQHFSLTFGLFSFVFCWLCWRIGQVQFYKKKSDSCSKGVNQLITADFKYQAYFSCCSHMRFTRRMTRSLLRGWSCAH